MTSPILVSVVICTHNPRSDYLSRVLQALIFQTLPKELWELLLIDNASERILSKEIDLSWHPHSRHIREEQLGLTPARLRGIKESVAEIIIFVDDDNVLDSDYLEVALQISKNYPLIGAWGGQIRPEFEEQPPEWTKPHWGLLAVNEFDTDRWSNVRHAGTEPYGVGLCVRKVVADKYADVTLSDPRRINLDRKGNSLSCGGDTDIALTSCDIGLGMGRFVALAVNHLIPPSRLEESYLVKIYEQGICSTIILDSFRGKMPSSSKTSWGVKVRDVYHLWRMPRIERLLVKARRRGESLAIKELSKH